MENSKLVQIHSYFLNQVKHFKSSNKNLVSFIILLGATLIIFIIFEGVLMPQLNCQSVLFSKEKGKQKREMAGVFCKLLPFSSTVATVASAHAAPALCRPLPWPLGG